MPSLEKQTHIFEFNCLHNLEHGYHSMKLQLESFDSRKLKDIVDIKDLDDYKKAITEKDFDFDRQLFQSSKVFEFCLNKSLIEGNNEWIKEFKTPVNEQDQLIKSLALLRLTFFFGHARYLTQYTSKFVNELAGGQFFHSPFAWLYLYQCVANSENLINRRIEPREAGELYIELMHNKDFTDLYEKMEKVCEEIMKLWETKHYKDIIGEFYVNFQEIAGIKKENFLLELEERFNAKKGACFISEMLDTHGKF